MRRPCARPALHSLVYIPVLDYWELPILFNLVSLQLSASCFADFVWGPLIGAPRLYQTEHSLILSVYLQSTVSRRLALIGPSQSPLTPNPELINKLFVGH